MRNLHLPITILILSLVALCAIQLCECYVHTQNVFCSATTDFVIKAKVKKIKNKPNFIKYKIKILDIFKSSAAFMALPNTLVGNKNKRFRTAKPGGMINTCTAQLIDEDIYVLTGKVSGTRLWISKCTDWIQDWSTLYPVEKDNLNTNYQPNCACQVEFIQGVPPPVPHPPTTCLHVSAACGRYSWCQCQNAACSSCHFEQIAAFQTCENNVEPPPMPPPGGEP